MAQKFLSGPFFTILVRLAGIEPTTPWFVAKYSIQLSYSRDRKEYISFGENGKGALVRGEGIDALSAMRKAEKNAITRGPHPASGVPAQRG